MTDSASRPERMDTQAPSVVGEAIRVAYRGRLVLDVEQIELPVGKTYALLGASGAGKSTLLRVLGLLEKPTSGRVLMDGAVVSRRDLVTRRTIAAVFQKPYMLRGTVGANVAYGLKLRGVRSAERRERASEALARVGLGGWDKRSALTLSGGEAQRVALARALVLQPRFLLLDEPLSYMDPLLKRQLTAEFAGILASERVTALYVTHDRDEAAVVADRIGIMREGRIVSEGAAADVLGLPEDEWLASFLDMEPSLEGVVDGVDGGLARIRCGSLDIFAVTDEPAGTPVLVGIRPEDVLLFEPGVELPKTSARNRIEGAVARVEAQGATARVVVTADGRSIATMVSSTSVAQLGLVAGSPVTLLFKATAVRVRRRDTIPSTV
jgi:molybdopterin-binding protein